MSNETITPSPEATAPAEPADQVKVASPKTAHRVQPVVDILETQEHYEILAEVPGVKREDITLQVEGDTLHLSAMGSGGHPAVRKPFHQLHFVRSFRLGRQIDREQVDAQLAHGVLRITLPKAKESQPRQVEVRVSEATQN